jgi:hypothetical protein
MTFVSLIVKTPQLIPPNTYTALRFDEESTDSPGWHDTNNLDSPGSALITPDQTAVAILSALVFWGAAPTDMVKPPTQYLHRFTRDPFTADIDSTATNDRAPTPGAQFHVFSWPMMIRAGQPLAVMVNHNGSEPLPVTLAEFKVWVP